MKPIDRMYTHFGKCPGHKCGECSNLGSYTQSRKWYKCDVYGWSASIATDWRKGWEACGSFDIPKPDNRRYIKDLYKVKTTEPAAPIEGQLALFKNLEEA